MGKEFGETIMGQVTDAVVKRFEGAKVSLEDALVLSGTPEAFGLSEIEVAAVTLRWFHAEVMNGGIDQWDENGYGATYDHLANLLDRALEREDCRSLAIRAVQDMMRVWTHRRLHADVLDAFDTCYYAIADQFLADMDEYFREVVAGTAAGAI